MRAPSTSCPLVSLLVTALVATCASSAAAQEPTPAPLLVKETAPTRFACTVADVRGLPPADAATATFLLCHALARASSSQGAFTVSLRPLGRVVVATVQRDDTGDARSANLENLAEITVASSRLADALLLGKSLDDTRRVQTVLSSEAEAPKSITGQRHIALSVLGLAGFGAGHGATAGGVSVGYLYELPRWSVGGHIEYAGNEGSADRVSFSYVSLGASIRRFFGDGDMAPFVGAGASLLWLSTNDYARSTSLLVSSPGRSRESSSLAPFVEGGLSFFRTTRARFVASVRVDVPLGELEDRWGLGSATPAPGVYVLPVSLRIGAQF